MNSGTLTELKEQRKTTQTGKTVFNQRETELCSVGNGSVFTFRSVWFFAVSIFCFWTFLEREGVYAMCSFHTRDLDDLGILLHLPIARVIALVGFLAKVKLVLGLLHPDMPLQFPLCCYAFTVRNTAVTISAYDNKSVRVFRLLSLPNLLTKCCFLTLSTSMCLSNFLSLKSGSFQGSLVFCRVMKCSL